MTLLLPMHKLPVDMPLHDFRQKSSKLRALKVLVVDDDRDVLEVMRIGLVNMGHDVETLDSGHDATTYIQNNRDLDLLIVDKDMPGVSGEAVVRQCIAINPDVKIVMVSGRFDDEDAESLGVDLTLDKPFTVSQLADSVSQVTQKNG